MNITIVCGSIAKKSHTRGILHTIEILLKDKETQIIFWDLADRPLPIAIPEYHHDPMQNPDKNVQEFITTINGSDGIVLGSPLIMDLSLVY